ncbi:MAG: hypothetical protein M3R04_04145, partial [bacterium]|nr:hypothetical protein [bacterium]
AWGAPLALGEFGGGEGRRAIAIVGGRPAIFLQFNSPVDFIYCEASNPEGTAWGAWQPIETFAGNAPYPCLISLGSKPAVMYRNGINPNSDIWFRRLY